MKSPMTLPLFWFHVHSSLSRSLLEVLLLFCWTNFGGVGWGGFLAQFLLPPVSGPPHLLHSPSRRAVKLLPLSAAVHLQTFGVFWQPRLRSHSLRPDLAGNPQTHSQLFFFFCARGCSKHQHKVRPHGSHQSSDKSCQPGPLRKKREAAVPELA